MPHRVQPYHLDDQMFKWAYEQQNMRHEDALWQLGELCMFVLLWSVEDHAAGWVRKCTTCETNTRIHEVYNQPKQNKCPDCFGTNFEGGYRAVIIRPTIISDHDPGESLGSRGVSHTTNIMSESTTDFRVREGDYLFRADNTRYRLRTPASANMRTGFGTPYNTLNAVGYHLNQGSLEDQTSVAYIIPPQADDLRYILHNAIRIPQDKSRWEHIRAPLIPEAYEQPASRKQIDQFDPSLSGDPENPDGNP